MISCIVVWNYSCFIPNVFVLRLWLVGVEFLVYFMFHFEGFFSLWLLCSCSIFPVLGLFSVFSFLVFLPTLFYFILFYFEGSGPRDFSRFTFPPCFPPLCPVTFPTLKCPFISGLLVYLSPCAGFPLCRIIPCPFPCGFLLFPPGLWIVSDFAFCSLVWPQTPCYPSMTRINWNIELFTISKCTSAARSEEDPPAGKVRPFRHQKAVELDHHMKHRFSCEQFALKLVKTDLMNICAR